ncbi:MAG: YhgE/Pip domain-containing protein [Oscillospiraceae bacterium]|nr:YhgE/Pip domain-containing protein [Oscillospiraceae bacterium]
MEKTEKKENFFKRHFKTIAAVGIITIPTIYTSFFLGSMWDPYGKVSSLPVAVVNNDRPVIYNNDVIDVGERLVEKLEDNDALAFNFVDGEVAEKGLENGTYYMVITIPENFSENAVTVLDDEPKKMVLNYSVNPGTNYIASKMSESAMVKLQKSVEESVVEEYTNTVFEKLSTIGSGMDEAAEGAGKLKDGSGKISEGTDTIRDNLRTLAESTVSFEEGASALRDGIKEYTDGVSSVNDGASKLSSGADALKSGAGTLSDGASKLSEGIKNYTDGVSSVNDGASALSDGASQLKSGSQSLLNGLNTLSGAIDNSLSEENINNIHTVQSGLTSLNEGIQELNTAIVNAEAAGMDPAAIEAVMKSNIAAIAANSEKLLPAANAAVDSLSGGLQTVQNALERQGTTPETIGIIQGAQALDAGIKQVSQGSGTLYEGTKQLMSNSSTLKDGAAALSSGAASLASGAEELRNGADTLKTGTGKLVSNNEKLVSGSDELYDGSAKIADGSSKLYDGSEELSDGVNELYDGCGTLESSLADGAAEINDTNKNDTNAKMFAAPVEIEETILTNPKNNGQAMAAYMMSVGLWVGCLAYCIMFSPEEAIAEKKVSRKNAVHYWIQEMTKVLLMAAVQAVIMVFALSGALGFEPANALRTVSVACMSSMAFMMLFYFFNILMGKIGSFLLLVFMVLQLSGAAGTYPIELSDSFYQKIHPFMPFTYTVNAFRSTIASGLNISTEIKILCGIFIVFLGLNLAAVVLKSSPEETAGKTGNIECTE